MQPEKLAMLQELVLEIGLNTHNLEYNEGLQEGCW